MPIDPAQEAVEQWKQEHVDQSLVRQRAQADGVKLVVTFFAAIAATLVATSLQIGRPSWLDVLATVGLIVTIVETCMVISSDRLREVDQAKVDGVIMNPQWTWDRRLEELRDLGVSLVDLNEVILSGVLKHRTRQLICASVASLVAVISLIWPEAALIWPPQAT